MRLARHLSEYLAQIGLGTVRVERSEEAGRRLPVFMGQAYEVHQASILGRLHTLLFGGRGKRPTPGEAAIHLAKARDLLGSEVAFVFSDMPAFDRKRYIERGIPFIVPGRQLFLPTALIDLRETGHRSSPSPAGDLRAYSAPAQALLIRHLLEDGAVPRSLSEWAEVLGYSASTMTRVRSELESSQLASGLGEGRSFIFLFNPNKRALWKRVKPRLRSPVRSRHHVITRRPAELPFVEAGLSALAHHTMLSAPLEPVLAIASPVYGHLVEAGEIGEVPGPDDDTIVVERWLYDPMVLSRDANGVDPLSLYLSLRNDPDERVQAALSELLEGLTW